ncbi:MAG: hypothetical protein QME50_05085, partial [Candidatus Bathyarchaeota archaeon]|nr:hypothetical protein [Candidatus Bathyarchaeota archaeon]
MRIFRKKEVLNSVKPPQKYPAGCNMAVRQDAIKKAGLFDESIKYGFDEDELVERICRSGYKMVLDPNVLVKHKHRPTLRELLRQNFNYGRGLGLMLRKMGIKSVFPKWIIICVISFLLWVSTILALMIHAILTTSLVYQVLLITMLLLPAFGLMIFYWHQTIKKKDKKYQRIILYPMVDIFRALAFVLGGLYQSLKKS